MAMEGSIERTGSEQCGRVRAVASRAVAAIDGVGRLLSSIVAKLPRGQGMAGKRKQMQLVESLALGNRRQLLLVVCDGQRYLVGAGADGVGSILAVEPAATPEVQPRPTAGVPIGAINCVGKRPELVRQRVRQILPEPKPGADRWQ